MTPFADPIFQQYTLEFAVSGGLLVENEVGDLVPSTAQAVPVKMFLKPLSSFNELRLREQMGADDCEVGLAGYCTNPSILPSNIKAGAKAPLTLDGIDGVFTLAPRAAPAITILPSILGTKITGGWRKGALP